MNLALDFSDDGIDDDDDDDDGLWDPMITKLSEHPTYEEAEISYDSPSIVSWKKLDGFTKSEIKMETNIRLIKMIYKCVLVSYDLGSLKKGEGVVVFEKVKLKRKWVYYEQTRRRLLKNVQLNLGV